MRAVSMWPPFESCIHVAPLVRGMHCQYCPASVGPAAKRALKQVKQLEKSLGSLNCIGLDSLGLLWQLDYSGELAAWTCCMNIWSVA